MPVPLDFLKDPWADTGDRAQFPYNPDTITELMSWLKGFTAKYQRTPEEGGVYIERREFNQILYLLSKQIIDAFKITASDERLDAEIADIGAGITDIDAEIADLIARLEAEITNRIQKDNDLQHQIDTKFINVDAIEVSFGVTYTADNSGVICVDLEWGNPGPFESPGCLYMNAELRCSNSSNPQFVVPCYGAWSETSQNVVAGARPNISLVAIIGAGDTFELKGETIFGLDAASGIIVKSARIMY